MNKTSLSQIRRTINQFYRMDEDAVLKPLIEAATLSAETLKNVQQRAATLIEAVRHTRQKLGGVDAFMQEYDLSGDEGIALMCMAEAMLRIPDKATADKLIADKVAMADWASHAGKSDSFFVNAATWGLSLTGKILSQEEVGSNRLSKALKSALQKTSAPVVRAAIKHVMKTLGEQFVMGQTIGSAQTRADQLAEYGYCFSYDMLGEAARTTEDAERYMQSYLHAIDEVGKKAKYDVIQSSGISIKLSALYPRYEFSHREAAIAALVPKLILLTQRAKQYNIPLTVDAEEADRLDMSLDIIEAVFTDPQFAEWEGFGLALQSYQKRAFYVLDWLIALAQQQKKRMFVRLIKGAYWDAEIKISQVAGFEGYPVFTRKIATDVSFLACARKMLAHPEAFYAQFATHNAFSVAAILELTQGRTDFEFQCLHGMGYSLYDEVLKLQNNHVACRVYAPVGGYEDLLAYLVRRLLENGANSSFVNRIMDPNVAVRDLVQDPIQQLAMIKPKANPFIPLPQNLYGETRLNSQGLDVSNANEYQTMNEGLTAAAKKAWLAKSTLAKREQLQAPKKVINPANHDEIVGEVFAANADYLNDALNRAHHAFDAWSRRSVADRAAILEKAADLLEAKRFDFMWLAIHEAGKTIFDAIGEVREAIDFCRYYAMMARQTLVPQVMPGPTGESNILSMHGRGVIACVSPWNFPLAIFMGQVTAALVAGNTVLAKPAGQTCLIAAAAVDLLHQAGVPQEVLQLTIASGSLVGQHVINDVRVKGVVFTGSTDTAQGINQTLAARPGAIVPLIAETGGQNAMIVDSSALPEQVVQDVITSAFLSAGQRCSALRVLFVQEDIADKVVTMLRGAMVELNLGDPALLTSDIGPVIDEAAKQGLVAHQQYLEQHADAKLIYQVPLTAAHQNGSFMAPCAYEIANIDVLQHEVFGPVLHVIRFKADQLDAVIAQINSTGFGLTMGIHSRIDDTIHYIIARVDVGNIYVNRNMVGAVVGVQPFGGEGLSGTGPKAGGPHYLLRLCTERTVTINTTAAGGNATLMAAEEAGG